MTVNFSHLATSFTMSATVFHLQKGCSEFWDSNNQQATSPRPKSVSPRPMNMSYTLGEQ